MNPHRIEAKNVGPLPHAQNFEWGKNYLPDQGTVCAEPVIPTSTPLPPTATPVPPTPTATPQPPVIITEVVTAVPTETAVATVLPTATPTLEVVAIPTPTEMPPCESCLPPPAQLPLENYPK